VSRNALRNLPLFDDASHVAEDKEVLQLDENGLLHTLNQWKTLSALPALRAAIAEFSSQIRDPRHSLRLNGSGNKHVEFSWDYFLGELSQIAESLTLDRARYYVDRLVKGVSEVRTSKINDINLNRWKEYEDIYTDSLWLIDRRDASGAHSAGYWGNFIPQIPHQMMRRYTKRGEWVLDTFAGSGTTLIEGQRLGRNTIGIELQDRMVEQAKLLVSAESNRYGVTVDVVCGDSTAIDYQAALAQYGQESVQLVVMHPPYFDIIRFSDDPRDLSNASSVDAFLAMLSTVVDKAAQVLDRGRYLVMVVGDKYANGEWIPLGFHSMNEVMERGFSLKSIIVKNFEETSGKRNQKELWRYRALVGGFYIFKHEYILVFKKR